MYFVSPMINKMYDSWLLHLSSSQDLLIFFIFCSHEQLYQTAGFCTSDGSLGMDNLSKPITYSNPTRARGHRIKVGPNWERQTRRPTLANQIMSTNWARRMSRPTLVEQLSKAETPRPPMGADVVMGPDSTSSPYIDLHAPIPDEHENGVGAHGLREPRQGMSPPYVILTNALI